jgi:hypothetical protein
MAKKYWYNTRTGEVEIGRQSPWNRRMGPYRTREEAEQAIEIARQRAAEWSAEEEWPDNKAG